MGKDNEENMKRKAQNSVFKSIQVNSIRKASFKKKLPCT